MFDTMLEIAEDLCGRAFDAIPDPGSRISDDRALDSLNRIGDTLHDMNMRSLGAYDPQINWKGVWDNLTHKNG